MTPKQERPQQPETPIRVEWDTGAIGFRGDKWIVLRDDDGSGRAAASMANLGEAARPYSSADGRPGMLVAHQIAKWADGKVVAKPLPELPPGTVY